MRFIFTLLLIFAAFTASAQHKIADKVSTMLRNNVEFKNVQVLSQSSAPATNAILKAVDGATMAKINIQAVNQIVANKYPAIEITVPYNGKSIKVLLYKQDILAENFHVDTDKAVNVSFEGGVHYRGTIGGNNTAVAAFSFFKNQMQGIVSADDLNNLVIGKIDVKGNTEDYIVYSDSKLKVLNQFSCAVKDQDTHDHSQELSQGKAPQSAKCVTMYFEIDHDLYLANNSSIEETTNWMTGVFNNVQTLYENDGITTALKSLYIWTEQDPYQGDASVDYLFQFNALRPIFDGDLGQLVGIDPGGLGGVAVTIDGLCNENNFCYSDVDYSYETVPTYSWSVMVITHEMGHLFGSRHTHSCAWNGNNTAIDNCAPYAIGSTAEGYSCLQTPPLLPSTTVKGTIMSYCHLVSGIGINFVNGFGPQPTNAILTNIASKSCLSSDCIATCINTVSAINVEQGANNTATVSWTDESSSGPWQVGVKLNSSSVMPTFNSVNSNTLVLTDLLPNTFYTVIVKPVCGEPLTASGRSVTFVTDVENICSGATLYDSGGQFANYGDMESYVRVLIPNIANSKMKLTFSQFDLEEQYDFLYIYDGATISSPLLTADGLTGSSLPGIYNSTSSDGALTLRFSSDQAVNGAGFKILTDCVQDLGVSNFANIDFTYYPNPSNGIVNISSKTEISSLQVFNIQGQLLYSSAVDSTDAKVNISQFASGTYFFKIDFEGKEVNFKILKN
ncbi:MAG: M12 family metallo-peptidase [Flavobacterium sp.]